MPLFDVYVMIDWSGGNGRRSNAADCIWIAFGCRQARGPITTSPASRTEAEQTIRQILDNAGQKRVLVCADFAYGYPRGFAALLPNAAGSGLLPWQRVWEYLSRHVRDDIDTQPGRVPSNKSDRFSVASAINQANNPTIEVAAQHGPFWCTNARQQFPWIPQSMPEGMPPPLLAARRITDERANSDWVFRLFGDGSVGSQVITGIPRLHSIRFGSAPLGPDGQPVASGDPAAQARREFADCSKVWPFETGWWTPNATGWPGARILHAEIYPSVWDPLPDPIRDRGQVRAMWHWARKCDLNGCLLNWFGIPIGIEAESPQDVQIRNEEGWILGCPPPADEPAE